MAIIIVNTCSGPKIIKNFFEHKFMEHKFNTYKIHIHVPSATDKGERPIHVAEPGDSAFAFFLLG